MSPLQSSPGQESFRLQEESIAALTQGYRDTEAMRLTDGDLRLVHMLSDGDIEIAEPWKLEKGVSSLRQGIKDLFDTLLFRMQSSPLEYKELSSLADGKATVRMVTMHHDPKGAFLLTLGEFPQCEVVTDLGELLAMQLKEDVSHRRLVSGEVVEDSPSRAMVSEDIRGTAFSPGRPTSSLLFFYASGAAGSVSGLEFSEGKGDAYRVDLEQGRVTSILDGTIRAERRIGGADLAVILDKFRPLREWAGEVMRQTRRGDDLK